MTALNSGRSSPVDLWRTILHNSDGESKLISLADQESFGGIDRFASVVKFLLSSDDLESGGLHRIYDPVHTVYKPLSSSRRKAIYHEMQ